MTIDRRRLIGSAAALAGTALASTLAAKVKPFTNSVGPRSRVMYVNDIAGDPDGRFATVHMALSTTSQLRAIVGTAATFPHDEGPDAAAALAKEILGLMGIKVPVHTGSSGKFGKNQTPRQSPGVQGRKVRIYRDIDTRLMFGDFFAKLELNYG